MHLEPNPVALDIKGSMILCAAKIEVPIPAEAQIAQPPPPGVGPASDPSLPVPLPSDQGAIAAASHVTT